MSGSEAKALAADQASKGDDSSVLLNLLPHILRTLKREPALAITLCYLLVAMAGIFYNYRFYGKFGIPVLSLSQISDFLIAGVQRPMALLLVASTFPIIWLFDKLNLYKRRQRKKRRDLLLHKKNESLVTRIQLVWLRSTPRWFTQLVYLFLVVIYGWVFVSVYAEYRADAVREGDAAQVRVWLNGDAAGLSPAQGTSWTYLGAVANYVFVFDRTANRSVILPVNNIVRIESVQSSHDAPPSIIVAPIP